MFTIVLIGFIGGLITGISPCILPVLPVIFFSGAQSARRESAAHGGVATAVEVKPSLSEALRPYRVIAGLVLSFSVVTLVGSALLSTLRQIVAGDDVRRDTVEVRLSKGLQAFSFTYG